jgi:hypothetical protein
MQPVIIEDTISIAANSINNNVIVSNSALRGLLEAPFPAMGKLLCVQSAAGLAVDLDYGSKNVVSAAEPRVATFAEDPLDIINSEWFCEEGDQLVLRVINTTAGALTFRYRIVLEPLVDESNWIPGQRIPMPPDTRVMQRGPIAITNNSIDVQLLDGLKYERVNVPSILRVLMTESAIGMTRQLFIEQDRIAPPSSISIANRIPQDPFDTTIDGVEVPANALQQLQVSNTSGGTLNVFWKTKNKELVRR